MHDPKFEKEVQQKMEGLEFSPSERVWANLQRGLNKEKRRRAPLFWLFFLLGGMMLGAGGASLFYFNRNSSRISGARSTTTGKTIDVTRAPIAAETNRPVGGDAEASVTGTPVTGTPVAGTLVGGIHVAGTPVTGTRRIVAARVTGTRSAAINKPAARIMTAASDPATIDGNLPVSRRLSVPVDRAGRRQVEPMTGLIHPDPEWDIASRLAKISLSSASTILNAPGLHISANRSQIVTGEAMNRRKAKKARFSNTPLWEAGFAGGGGLSSAVLSPPSSFTTNNPPVGLNLISNLQSSAAAPLQLRFSKIQPDLSFWAGIFVQRPVLKKLTLNFGFNLHYYSTRLETGQKAADSVNRTPSYFSPNPYAQYTTLYAPYYSPETYRYSNHYYFLEVPISLQWQFNRSRKTPLFWEGGLSLSRLISANALYYNEKSGVYYKDGGGANPNHLMAFSSLMIGLSWRGDLIKLGPEAQYGLSSLINANDASTQHLFYGGIKITVVPKKW
jgi:hypothetical protein